MIWPYLAAGGACGATAYVMLRRQVKMETIGLTIVLFLHMLHKSRFMKLFFAICLLVLANYLTSERFFKWNQFLNLLASLDPWRALSRVSEWVRKRVIRR
ncbi:hypothetical protein PMAYCL1PPCAC_21336, partial [Pristionchus mayeri]